MSARRFRRGDTVVLGNGINVVTRTAGEKVWTTRTGIRGQSSQTTQEKLAELVRKTREHNRAAAAARNGA